MCNGCQLMALLGWVPGTGGGGSDGPLLPSDQQPRFLHNDSGRCACLLRLVLDMFLTAHQQMQGTALRVPSIALRGFDCTPEYLRPPLKSVSGGRSATCDCDVT